MIWFDAAHAAVHYPPDRRFRVWIRPSFLIAAAVLALLPVLTAWIELFLVGLPYIPGSPQIYPDNLAGPHGFPLWVRYCHFFNVLFVTMLIRSGLSILVDHPRLYFNNHCTPGSEWIRFTPTEVPTDRLWTAKDDNRYISPIVATPGYRHTVGIARSWHFLNVYGFILTGIFFVITLFDTEHWRRLVPQSTLVLLQAWNTWVHYAIFHLPPEVNGYYGYNALQQTAYFAVVFVFGPLAILTGIAMSPAAVNRFPWYAKLFGGRQSARSIHFEFTRECLAIRVARRLNSYHVMETLGDCMLAHGVPEHVRSDNGAEMTACRVKQWLHTVGTRPLFIEPGSPWENGYC
jgi:methionine sulfoxide reductase catalytic subunit